MKHQTAAVFALTSLFACGEPREEDNATTVPTGVDSNDATGTAGSGATSTDDGSDSAADSTGGGTKLDVGAGATLDGAGDGDEDGCDKVDFLFVIDNSGSMGDEQSNMTASFPGFIETITTELDIEQDFHILVTDVDGNQNELCEAACDCANPETGVCDPATAPGCDLVCFTSITCELEGFDCAMPPGITCDTTLGAGITTQGNANNQDCAFTSGARYMDSTEPDLTQAFTCAANVGTNSFAPTELVMESMVNAVSPSTDAAECNEGFIRDDAILVVTFITDENDNDGDSSGTVEGWRQALIAAKGGDESAVVVLGLFGDNDQPAGICADLADGNDGAEAAPRLRQFLDSWGDHGFFGSVCAASYTDFFNEAVGIIDTTCEDFVPPQG